MSDRPAVIPMIAYGQAAPFLRAGDAGATIPTPVEEGGVGKGSRADLDGPRWMFSQR